MQKIPNNQFSWMQSAIACLLIVLIPMLGVFQFLGIQYQRQLTKQCIFNQMGSEDVEVLFLDEARFSQPKPGSEFWLNNNKYDVIRVSPIPGGWQVVALNDNIEKLAEQAMRAENAKSHHPGAKKYIAYNDLWGLESGAVLIRKYLYNKSLSAVGITNIQVGFYFGVFRPPCV